MRIFILEDNKERMRHFRQNCVGAVINHASTAEEADYYLRYVQYDAVFLDYDLDESGLNCGCGGDVSGLIRMFCEQKLYRSADIMHCIHSMNPPGAQDMYSDLKAVGLQVSYCQQAWLEKEALEHFVQTGEWRLPARQGEVIQW
jgi:hypothetical protein